jgi:hypothetical protein
MSKEDCKRESNLLEPWFRIKPDKFQPSTTLKQVKDGCKDLLKEIFRIFLLKKKCKKACIEQIRSLIYDLRWFTFDLL